MLPVSAFSFVRGAFGMKGRPGRNSWLPLGWNEHSCFWFDPNWNAFLSFSFQDPAGIFELVEVVGNGTYGQVYKVGWRLRTWPGGGWAQLMFYPLSKSELTMKRHVFTQNTPLIISVMEPGSSVWCIMHVTSPVLSSGRWGSEDGEVSSWCPHLSACNSFRFY